MPMAASRVASRLSALTSQITITTSSPLIGHRTFNTSKVRASMAPTQEWMVIIPDKPGMLETRMKVRPDHLAALKPNVESGFIVMGGASLDEPMQEGQGAKANGSVLLAVADTKDEVLANLEKDPYVEAGVWDLEKAQIFPFKSALRQAL